MNRPKKKYYTYILASLEKTEAAHGHFPNHNKRKKEWRHQANDFPDDCAVVRLQLQNHGRYTTTRSGQPLSPHNTHYERWLGFSTQAVQNGISGTATSRYAIMLSCSSDRQDGENCLVSGINQTI
jgi:hypothetical protein